ncbi:DNA helicase [Subtercola lobariae]|uniref:DNA 3'-5' helicase n=1 Tax=Subtercola lobariae TaxID=1588641 RepID=A0A917B850_9MICO|nr:DNA helicase [Subtercola lobariae]
MALADDVNVAVIGAPGSGKTHTLVELVADRVLNRGFDPSELVVLTPSRQSATRLRDRLALRLGVPTNGPLARTVNSLAFQIVQAEAVVAGLPSPTLLTGAEQDRIIAELLAGHLADGTGPAWPAPLTPDVRALRGFRTELRELLMRATEDGVSPGELRELGRRHEVPEWVAAGEFAAEYGAVVAGLDEAHLDSAELIAAARLAVVRGDSGGAPGLQTVPVLGSLRLVVVDDFHELASGAVNFLSTLARRGVSIIAFGDPDVATASFRGGEKDGLGRLGSVLAAPVAEPLYLSTVYRHGPGIRSLVDRATARIGAAAAGKQRAARAAEPVAQLAPAEMAAAGGGVVGGAASGGITRGVEPVRRVFSTSTAGEVAAIAHVLREHHLLGGVPWRDMAVVVRSGALLSSFSRGLALAEVPTSTVSGGLALRDDFAARQLITAIMIAIGALELTDPPISELLLGPFGGLDAVSLRRLRLSLRQEELAGDGNRTAEELLRDAVLNPGRLVTIDSAPARRVGRLAANLDRVRTLNDEGASAEELLWQLFSHSGLSEQWLAASRGSGILADEANRNLDGVVGVFTAAKRFVERTPNRPAIDFFVGLLEAEVAEDSLSPRSAADAVVVSTPNGVIGTEFDVVVVARLQDSVWPNLRLRGSLLHPDRLSAVVAARPLGDVDERAEVLGDELRMFALAASRAKTQVVLSAVANDDEQPSPFTRLVPGAPGAGGEAAGGETAGGESAGGEQAAVESATVDSTLGEPAAGHPLSLRSLTGALRRRLVETGDPGAAAALARLAAEGVPGAHPESWYGLLEPSTLDELVDLSDPDAVVDVSPSKLETFEKSPLAWYIDKVSGGTFGLPAGIGTLLHSVMEEVTKRPDPDFSVVALWDELDERWNELHFESPWLAERERRRTETKVRGLSEYLQRFERDGGTLLGGEESFTLDVGRARLRGTVDRVELRPDGHVSVVDLKTGNSTPKASAVEKHAQLGSYQLALANGLIGGERPPGSDADPSEPVMSDGAVLLYVAVTSGSGANKVQYKLLAQAPLDAEAEAEFRQRIEEGAEGMAGSVFPGREGLDERDPHGRWNYRIHLVKAVSA